MSDQANGDEPEPPGGVEEDEVGAMLDRLEKEATAAREAASGTDLKALAEVSAVDYAVERCWWLIGRVGRPAGRGADHCRRGRVVGPCRRPWRGTATAAAANTFLNPLC